MNVMTEIAKPWYREPWPWLLMAGPGAVVIAGLVTFWLCVNSDDGVVAEDYYKRGLAINQTLLRAQTAENLKLGARVTLDGANGHVLVAITGTAMPPELQLRLVHPTRAVADQVILLRVVTPGTYAGDIPMPPNGRRVILLEDPGRTWRLGGEALDHAQTMVVLTPQ